MRVEVNNYNDVFPTGKLLPVIGTQYDFNALEGGPLPDTLVDDSYVDLTPNAQGDVVSEIRDLGANYGMRVTAMSPHIRAIPDLFAGQQVLHRTRTAVQLWRSIWQRVERRGYGDGDPCAWRIRHLEGSTAVVSARERHGRTSPSSQLSITSADGIEIVLQSKVTESLLPV